MSEPAATPPPDPPADPPRTDLEDFIDRFSNFDPGSIERRLGELSDRIGATDVVAALREAIDPAINDLTEAVKGLRGLVEKTVAQPAPASPPAAGGDPPGGAPAPPVAPPAPPAPPEPPQSGGLAATLFGIPKVP